MISCAREGCARQVPALPWIDGAGDYCSEPCREGRESLTEPYSRDRFGPYPVSFDHLAQLAGLSIKDATVVALVLRFADAPVTVDGIGVADDVDVIAEHAARALDAYDRHGDRGQVISHKVARQAGRYLRGILDTDWSAHGADPEELAA